jgi:hypothetical protein
VLLFEDPEAARAAAGAIAYARAADADVSQWVSAGLPTCFALEFAGAAFEWAAPGGDAAAAALGPGPWGGGVRLPAEWGSVLAREAAEPRAPIAPASSLSLCRAFSGLPGSPLAAGAAGGPASPRGAAAGAGGPAALAVTVATPLGLAVARVRLDHLVALQRDPTLCSALAVPLLAGAAGGSNAGAGSWGGGLSAAAADARRSGADAGDAAWPEPCFTHTVTAALARAPASGSFRGAAALVGSSGGGSALNASASAGSGLDGQARGSGGAAAAAAGPLACALESEGSAGGSERGSASLGGGDGGGSGSVAGEVQHSQRVYAVVQLALVCLGEQPEGGGDEAQQPPAAGAPAAPKPVAHAAPAVGVPAWLPARPAPCAGPAWQALGRSFALVLLTLLAQAALLGGGPAAALEAGPLLTAAALALAAAAALSSGAGTPRAAPAAGTPQGLPAPAAVLTVRVPQAAGEATSAPRRAAWELRVVGASLVTQPDACVQAQVQQHRAAAAAAAAAAAGAEGATAAADRAAPAAPAAASVAAAAVDRRDLPMLVSDPEPAWLTPDIHRRWAGGEGQWGEGGGGRRACAEREEGLPATTRAAHRPPFDAVHPPYPRFIQAKATLKASRDQARLTHEWRQRLAVDTILERPPGLWFEVGGWAEAGCSGVGCRSQLRHAKRATRRARRQRRRPARRTTRDPRPCRRPHPPPPPTPSVCDREPQGARVGGLGAYCCLWGARQRGPGACLASTTSARPRPPTKGPEWRRPPPARHDRAPSPLPRARSAPCCR